MRKPDYSTQFKRDFKKAEFRGKEMAKLDKALALLLAEADLPSSYKDHPLKGMWKHYRELHLEDDWLLVYKIVGDVVVFARTGTHSDIFNE